MKVDAKELQTLVDALPGEQPSQFGMRWVCGLFLGIFAWFSFSYYAGENTIAAIGTLTGVSVFGFCLFSLRGEQQPPWIRTLIASYLLVMLTYLILSNTAGGSAVMWMFVAPYSQLPRTWISKRCSDFSLWRSTDRSLAIDE